MATPGINELPPWFDALRRAEREAADLRAENERLRAENRRLKDSIDLCSGSCRYEQSTGD